MSTKVKRKLDPTGESYYYLVLEGKKNTAVKGVSCVRFHVRGDEVRCVWYTNRVEIDRMVYHREDAREVWACLRRQGYVVRATW